MKYCFVRGVVACLSLLSVAAQGFAANKETIETVDAYIGENSVRVDVFCRNEIGLLEYFNLIIFDDAKLDFVSIDADRGSLWYGGTYPTEVIGDHIYVHGIGNPPSYCIDPDLGDPGSPLFHIVFNVKQGVSAGLAGLVFSSEGAFDGHWNDCSGYTVSPPPDYYNGGVNILGHAGHITIGSDSASAGGQAAVDVYLHNDLDVYEYFHQILFEDTVADVDSIVALRGGLHYGYYPTHVSGDTIFVHGWAATDDCFYADHSYPGAALYRIYFTLDGGATPGYTMPLAHLSESMIWNHWVGCDLYTTDAFTATDGFVYVLEPTGAEAVPPLTSGTRLGQAVPNPATHGIRLSYYLAEAGHVAVTIYDASGKKVKTLVKGLQGAGQQSVSWDGTDEGGRKMPSGVYFYRLQTGSATLSKKLVVVR